jgi:hypothetical protein
MKISSLFELNLALSFWEIMKKELGARAIALPPSFVVTLFVSWSASRSKNVVLFDKATVRMPFVMGFSLLTRLLSFVLLLGNLKLIPKNTGSSLKHFMASVAVRGTVLLNILSRWDFMLTTSSISLTIPPSNHYFAASWVNDAKLISWGL